MFLYFHQHKTIFCSLMLLFLLLVAFVSLRDLSHKNAGINHCQSIEATVSRDVYHGGLASMH